MDSQHGTSSGYTSNTCAPAPGQDLEDLVALDSDAAAAARLRELVQEHGREVIEAWSDGRNKHQHKLVHIAASKNFRATIYTMAELGFNLNVQRKSDSCTPLHVAVFYKKRRVADALLQSGADPTLKNSYGEACDEKYDQLVASYQNIIWLDLELTGGFYDDGDKRILEVAAIITDKDLNELGRGQWVVGEFSEADLNGFKDFHQINFRDAEDGGKFPPLPDCPGNGLFTAIVESSLTLQQAEKELLALLKKHCPENACPIAGNSIQCDREVLKYQMPQVYKYLSHQIVDVSSFIGMAGRWLPEKVDEWKQDQKMHASYDHRALNDVDASIQSMRWIRSNLLVQPAASDA
mmetsp:Transcript_90916/g.161837  ORF Transcript_90916/g.161837 Transcript_90916/m.161837 type:complete len:350 (+) Transcript_90916:60-1109(+)